VDEKDAIVNRRSEREDVLEGIGDSRPVFEDAAQVIARCSARVGRKAHEVTRDAIENGPREAPTETQRDECHDTQYRHAAAFLVLRPDRPLRARAAFFLGRAGGIGHVRDEKTGRRSLPRTTRVCPARSSKSTMPFSATWWL